ncbi:hypothetical protein PoMZ_11306 [Pyricularia oryzae]|uniref:Uncharacterized protein n=1 Tax=Pyricularia oryzae TaxID=318829 RepID=A0A4P7NK79_PYROR|nr:hypothetical protein PoMZ_11306 [Pyricularia oryzae]
MYRDLPPKAGSAVNECYTWTNKLAKVESMTFVSFWPYCNTATVTLIKLRGPKRAVVSKSTLDGQVDDLRGVPWLQRVKAPLFDDFNGNKHDPLGMGWRYDASPPLKYGEQSCNDSPNPFSPSSELLNAPFG